MGSEINSVVIVGERVDLTDETHRNLESVSVNFTEYYMPLGISEEDKPLLKKLFRDVFTKSVETSLPCNMKDKALIKKSLQFRAGLLRNELLTISKNKDYVQPRETIDHFKKLKTLLDRFDLLPCIDSVEISGEVGDLDDNKIDKLLKEFIFVLLQAHNPNNEFKDKTAYAQDIVRRLLKDPVDFEKVLAAFNGKIPKRLQDLLTCMNSVTQSQIELMVKERMKVLTDSIITKIETVYNKNHSFWSSVNRDDILSIIDALLQSIQALQKELGDKEKELGALRASDNAVTGLGLKELPARIKALEEEVARLRAKIDTLEGAAKGGDEVKRLKEALEAAQLKNEELQGHITRLEGELNALRGSGPSEDLNKKIKELQEEINKEKAKTVVTLTPQEIAQLMAQLEEQNKLLNDQEILVGLLRKRLIAAEQRTQGNPALVEENKKLREALEKLQASESALLGHITTLEGQLLALKGSHRAELETLQAKNAELLVEIKKLNEQIIGLGGAPGSGSETNKSKLQSLQENLTRLQGQIDEMTQQMEALKAKHNAEIAEKIKEINRLTAENAAYKKSIKELKALNDQISKELAALKTQLATKEAALASLKSGATPSEAQLADLLEQIKSLKEQIEILTQEYEAAKATLNEVEGDYQAIMDMVNGLDTDVDAIQEELAALRKRCPEGVVNTGGTAEEKAMANLFKYLIRKTQDLSEGLKRNEAGLKTNEAIDTFINAIKAKEAELFGCGSKGDNAKAAIDAVTEELKAIREKAAASLAPLKVSGEDKDRLLAAAEAAVAEAQASQAAAEQQAETSRAEAEAANKAAADSSNKSNNVIALIKEANAKIAEADRKLAAASANQRLADQKILAVDKAEEKVKFEEEAARAAIAVAEAATEEAAVKEAQAKKLSEEAARISAEAQLAVQKAQKERDEALTAKTAAEQQAAASKEAAEKALEEKEAALDAAIKEKAKVAKLEEALHTAAEEMTAAGEAQKGIQEAISECQDKLKESLDKIRQNKSDIALIIAALGSSNPFDPTVEGEDGGKLKEAITKLLKDVYEERTSNEVIVKLAEELKAGKIPTPEELTITPDSPLAQLIEAIRAFKMPPVAKEQELNQLCYLLFFSSHIISTHFPEKNDIQELFEGILNNLMNPTEGTTKYSNISLIIEYIMPLLNYMEQIYQSTDNGDFAFIIKEGLWGRDILQIIQGKITVELRNKINDLFLSKTGNRTINDVFITIGEKDKFSIIKFKDNKATVKLPITEGNYSRIATKLQVDILSDGNKTTEKNDTHIISYPILFYFFMFAFKAFIKNRPGIIADSKCRLPKILQA